MEKRRKPKNKPSAPAGNQALTFAKLLGSPDPAKQLEVVQQLLHLAAAPVLTLVIQVDSRAPEGTVWVSNIGPAITPPVAHMMLAAATRQLAEQSARQQAVSADQANTAKAQEQADFDRASQSSLPKKAAKAR